MPKKTQRKKSNKNNKSHQYNQLYFILTLIAVILAFFIGLSVNLYGNLFGNIPGTQIIKNTVLKEKPVYIPEGKGISVRTIGIPAVSAQGEGIFGKITVILKKGTGNVLMNIGNILIGEDTEHSARKAAYYAFNYTDKNPDHYDVGYQINIEAPAIEGASAGAAMAIATIAALKDLEINKSISITGTINHDGTIGPASGILEKAEAAKKNNKSLFLVPNTQSKTIKTEEEEYCRNYGNEEFCGTEMVTKEINIEEEVGIPVREVKNISEALNYFVVPKHNGYKY